MLRTLPRKTRKTKRKLNNQTNGYTKREDELSSLFFVYAGRLMGSIPSPATINDPLFFLCKSIPLSAVKRAVCFITDPSALLPRTNTTAITSDAQEPFLRANSVRLLCNAKLLSAVCFKQKQGRFGHKTTAQDLFCLRGFFLLSFCPSNLYEKGRSHSLSACCSFISLRKHPCFDAGA